MQKSLQETYAPLSICFGCGPANQKGLRIRSFEEGDSFVAEWHAEPHHEAFPGVLNGGIIGALLDCHSNWAAARALMKQANDSSLPSTVTAEFAVKLLRPTPSKSLIRLVAKITDIKTDRATVYAELSAGGKVCDTCTGTFIAVQPRHPAYHRW